MSEKIIPDLKDRQLANPIQGPPEKQSFLVHLDTIIIVQIIISMVSMFVSVFLIILYEGLIIEGIIAGVPNPHRYDTAFEVAIVIVLGGIFLNLALIVLSYNYVGKKVENCRKDANVPGIISLIYRYESLATNKAVKALRFLDSQRLIDECVHILSSRERKGLQGWAIEVLGESSNSKFVPLLVSLLEDKEYSYRGSVIHALGNLQHESSVVPLINFIEGNNKDGLRIEAATALTKIKDPRAVLPLVKMLESKHDLHYIRRNAGVIPIIKGLGEMKDARATLVILANLRDRSANIRVISAHALGKIGDEKAVSPLIETLKDSSIEVRRAAARALGKIGDERAVEPLMYAFQFLRIQRVAAWALGEIGDQRAVKVLLEANLRRENINGTRKAIAIALGKIGDPDTLPYLEHLASLPNEEVRQAAQEAMARLEQRSSVGPPAS